MKRRKFVVAGTVIGSLMLTQGAFAAELAVTPSQNKLSVQSGNLVQNVDAVPAYLYQGNNYFKLRDVGKIVGYNVIWDNATKRISMDIIQTLARELGESAQHVENVVRLLDEGNTIPFIAR